jgi:hypothetical protein
MNSLSFTLQHLRSTHTLRVNYGLEGMKYIIQVYEGEINGHGEKEGLPTELNRQKLVERFGGGRCFRLFHSLSQKDQKFGHL